MSKNTPPVTYNFNDFTDLFTEMGALGTPSELHGLLCGQLAVGLRFDEQAWQTMVIEHMDVPVIEDHDDKAELDNWYNNTLAQLEAYDFSFTLLLPDDDDLLSNKVEALGNWCAGFLSGFGLGYDHKKQQLTEDVSDAMEHLAQISQVSVEDWDEDTDNDEEEQNYTDIMEYVRVVVMMVFGEYNQPSAEAAAKIQPQLH